MRVENMTSSNGNSVPNQFVIQTDNGMYFQSYRSIIAFRSLSGKVVLDRVTWDCSPTTGKYRNQFLGERIAETRKKIESGEYVLDNLNS